MEERQPQPRQPPPPPPPRGMVVSCSAPPTGTGRGGVESVNAERAGKTSVPSSLEAPGQTRKPPPSPSEPPSEGGGGADASLLPPHANRLLRLLGDGDPTGRAGRRGRKRRQRRGLDDMGTSSSSSTSTMGLDSAATLLVRDVVPTLAQAQAWEVMVRFMGGGHLGRRCDTSPAGCRYWRGRGGIADAEDADEADAEDASPSEVKEAPILTLDWVRDNWKRISRDDACLLVSRSLEDQGGDDCHDDLGEADHDVEATWEAQLRSQTTILHRRLGLSGPLGQVSTVRGVHGHRKNDGWEKVDDTARQLQLTREDLSGAASAPWTDHEKKEPGCRTRKRRRAGDDVQSSLRAPPEVAEAVGRTDRDDTDPRTRVGALPSALLQSLVRDGDAGRRDHKRRHDALAVDLMGRMVDPAWHVRHGAMLAALALIKGEWIPSTRDTERSAWMHSVLATSAYVLALDRFGDFSGALLYDDASSSLHPPSSDDAHDNCASTILASSVVAPVREVAGQVLAAAWTRLSPPSLQSEVLDLLSDMSRDADEWEIRHGALTAFKYMTALVLASGRSDDEELNEVARVKRMIESAVEALQDKSDDVVSVAADLLLQYYQHFRAQPQGLDVESLFSSNVKETVARRLWKLVLRSQSHSSCLVSLMDLLRLFVQSDCRGFLLQIEDGRTESADHRPITPPAVELAGTLARLLGSEFASVRVAVLQCINGLALPLAEQSAATGHCDAYVLLLDRVYELFWDAPSSTTVDHGTDEGGDPARQSAEALQIARSEAWQALVAHARIAFSGQEVIKRMHVTCSLLRRYFDIRDPVRSQFVFDAFEAASFALSSFLLAVASDDDDASLPSIVELYILSFLRSPWLAHCEAACLLISSLFRPGGLSSVQTSSFRNRLAELLWDAVSGSLPIYALVAEPTLTSLGASLEYSQVIQDCDDAFEKVANRVLVLESGSNVSEMSDMIVEVWRRSIEGRTGAADQPIEATVNSMRVSSVLAGATLKVMLPRTVTPVARALITSLKNEVCHSRLVWTCNSICTLLLALDDDSRFSKAQEKVLQAICNIAGSEGSECSGGGASYFPGSQTLSKYLSQVLSRKSLVDVGPVWTRIAPLLDRERACESDALVASARFLHNVRDGLRSCSKASYVQIVALVDRLVALACETEHDELRSEASATLLVLCSNDEATMLPIALERIIHYFKESTPVSFRTHASYLLESTVAAWGEALCPYVKALLPVVLSLMTDSCEACCRFANKTFASLVRLAPLTQEHTSIPLSGFISSSVDDVIDHLIVGKPLRPVVLAEPIRTALSLAGVTLRAYQKEGVAWLRFLQQLKLNGALCDSMGLGKTLQALVAIALSHSDDSDDGGAAVSLIVCPSTLVGHWMAEIIKFFPGSCVFRPLCYMGSKSQREALWGANELTINLVVTSYAVLRNDVDILTKRRFRSCTLDEGHLLKNHTTATARAARRLQTRHRLVLTGTPVQNRVHELWAIFDFLMPNFLGSSASFASEFAKPIMKGQLDGASSTLVVQGLEKLRILHQQVLPFLLRREKSEVLKELPPKVVSYIVVPMSPAQAQLYRQLCSNATVQTSLSRIDDLLVPNNKPSRVAVDGSVLKSLMLLRLLCTHPAHLSISASSSSSRIQDLSASGKMVALFELMRNAGLGDGCVTGADSDESLLYCDDPSESVEAFERVVDAAEDAGLVPENPRRFEEDEKKCIVFAQFTKSLDLVENLVLKPLMPHLRYIRLDGRVPVARRAGLAHRFNSDPSVRLLLSTTRVGGLGLNLTGADTVFFLENDYNPFVDIQAQDRAHRIGQTKSVNVYNLVTENSIEEKIVELQRRKVAVSEAIVNSDNSSMLSIGTDRILDVFASRSGSNGGNDEGPSLDMDALIEQHSDDYASLSVDEFLKGLE